MEVDSRTSNGDLGADRRVGLVSDDLEIVDPVVVDAAARRTSRSCGNGRGSRCS
jgi:hypothetical protein